MAQRAAIGQSCFGISRHVPQAKFPPPECHSLSVTPGTLYVFPKFVSQSNYLFVCLFELGLYYFKVVFILRTYEPHTHITFQCHFLLGFQNPSFLGFQHPSLFGFKKPSLLEFQILLYLDSKIPSTKPYTVEDRVMKSKLGHIPHKQYCPRVHTKKGY